MREGWIWERLGIEPTEDVGAIRRTYARLLKAIDTEADPAAFISLREARDAALAVAAGQLAPADAIAPLSWSPAHIPFDSDPEPSAAVPEADAVPRAEPPPLPPPERPPEPIHAPPEPGDSPPPEPGPRPRMIVAQSALPELDGDDLELLDSLLISEETPPWAELDSITRKILNSPAAERIDIAHWLEGWAADRIARFTPRSDPMIEPAVEHFRWDSEHPDLNRPPVIDWILQRRTDREFELALQETSGRYDRLIRELRRAQRAPPGPLVAWWRGVRVEFLLAYLQTLNPTVLAGLDQDSLAWWEGHIATQAEAKGLGRKVRDWRSRRIFDQGIIGPKPVDWPLMLGILVMPYVFAWFLLQRGYGMAGRLLAFGWLALLVLAVLAAPAPNELTYQGRSIEPHYLDMETDVEPIVAWATEGNLTLARIAGTEPGLFRILSDRWSEAAGDRENGGRFRESIVDLLQKTYCEVTKSEEAVQVCAHILARKAAGAARADSAQSPPMPTTVYNSPVAPVNYRSMEEDVDPILMSIGGRTVNVDRLRKQNLGLYSALIEKWNTAQAASTPAREFHEEIARLLEDDIESVLRGGSYELQSAYWRLFADQAVHARTLGDEICDSWLKGDRGAVASFPPEIEERRKALSARALLDSEDGYLRVFGASPSRSLTVPPAIAGRAASISGLDRAQLSVALIGGGTAAQRCDARIGLLEATLSQPREQAERVFEQIAGGF